MVTIRPAAPDDLDRIVALRAQAFNIDEIPQQTYRSDPHLEEVIVVEIDGRVVATTRAIPFAHFFGGRTVEAGGISGVAVAAEARGRGVGSAMILEQLRELRGHAPIASLYPATVPIYRKAGFGFGGIRTFWKARQDALPQSSSVRVEPFDDGHLPEVNAAYERFAAGTNGLVRRSEDWWRKRVLSDWKNRTVYRYLVREDGEVTGWIVYTLEHASAETFRSNVEARDLIWTTAAAGRALISLGALHRSTGLEMTWPGPPTDPLADLMPEDPVESRSVFRWMLRLLDVQAALEARGYPPLVDTAVSIGVVDPLFPENEGPWRIEVSGGQAKVFPTEQADATADVQTWASIWSGLHRARDAVRLGGLRATPAAIDALEAIFAGPLPWLADFF
ncbi:MAG: GNAT family N-acetyltransferase [Actinomycetota bacterium]